VRAGVSTQANQGVFVLMCLLCVVVRRKESRRKRTREIQNGPKRYTERTFVIVKVFLFGFKDNKTISR
jgi:uncharacterized membrane protein